ncbi:MAG: head decoration protein [Aliarcobacter butzleri]|nr:head decoration protein [Aliarcobacter butzleri]
MGQPVYTEEVESNPLVLSDWRADDNGILVAGTNYKKGMVLGKITNEGPNKGKYKHSLSTSSDGSEKPYAILLDDVDATDSDLNGPILLGGKVDKNLLILGTGHTLDSIEVELRSENIYFGIKG